jgi:hypothetical protein
MLLAPVVHAKPVTPVVAVAATQIELEVAEIGKDGVRRATTLTLSLPDHSGRLVLPAELKTPPSGERGESAGYDVEVMPENTAAGMCYRIRLQRAGNDPSKGVDLRIEVVRVLKIGVPVQIGRVTRADGSGTIVTATVR